MTIFSKTLLASALTLSMMASVYAADPAPVVAPAATAAMTTHAEKEAAEKTVRADAKVSKAECKKLSGAEKRACKKEVRAKKRAALHAIDAK